MQRALWRGLMAGMQAWRVRRERRRSFPRKQNKEKQRGGWGGGGEQCQREDYLLKLPGAQVSTLTGAWKAVTCALKGTVYPKMFPPTCSAVYPSFWVLEISAVEISNITELDATQLVVLKAPKKKGIHLKNTTVSVRKSWPCLLKIIHRLCNEQFSSVLFQTNDAHREPPNRHVGFLLLNIMSGILDENCPEMFSAIVLLGKMFENQSESSSFVKPISSGIDNCYKSSQSGTTQWKNGRKYAVVKSGTG